MSRRLLFGAGAVIALIVLATAATGALAIGEDPNALDRPDDVPGENASAADNATTPDETGPPGDLPEVVPDFVSEMHETIRNFQDGLIDHLGNAVSDITG